MVVSKPDLPSPGESKARKMCKSKTQSSGALRTKIAAMGCDYSAKILGIPTAL